MSAEQRWPDRRAAGERTALRSVPIFADIDDDQLESAVDRHQIPANEWLFRMGDRSDAIYIVDSGRFAVVGADGQVFREMASGDSIGDLGLITGAVRSAGVRALRDGVVWRIAADTFTECLPTLRNCNRRCC
jgi:NTE family protein